jgi:hypothetical protein
MAGLPERTKTRFFFWLGLIVLTFLYGLYYFYFLNGLAFTLALRARHLVKFLFILCAYGIGAFALPKVAAGWVMRIWHVVYGIGLLLLILLGLYDWGIARAPLGIREVADDLQELLVSPILYCVIAILNRSLDRLTGQN